MDWFHSLDFLTFIVLLRVPILNNHAVSWCALILIAWLTQRKILTKNENPYLAPLRVLTALVALAFFAGIGEVAFDPFWIVYYHIPLGTYFRYMVGTSFFYTGLMFGLFFFKFDLRRFWVILLPIEIMVLWVILGFHTPADMTSPIARGSIYYYEFTANLFDILSQVTAFIAGYYMISSLRLLKWKLLEKS